MNPTLVDSREKVRGCRAKYNWHALRNALNLLRSPENLSGVGTLGSGGSIITVGAVVVSVGAAAGEGAVIGPAEVAKDCTRSSSWT